MTILSNDEKTIRLSCSAKIHISCDPNSNTECYNIESPTISCSDMRDAQIIQQKVNAFVVSLGRDLLNKK